MKIERIETIPVSIPIDPKVAIRGGRGAHTVSVFVLVKVHTDEGLVGIGEVSCTPGWSGEDHVSATHFVETYLSPALVGQDPSDIERCSRAMDRALAGNPFTKAGVEIALWDLLAKRAGLPLYELLGGAVRDVVPTKFSVSGVEPDRAADIATWAVEQGFTAMKVKVGIDPDEDVARVAAVREAIGPHVRLGVDANGGWLPRVAVRTIERLAEFDLYFVEQPVPAHDVSWLADVRRRTSLPIVADESVFGLQDAMAVVRSGAADVLSVYVGKGGGIGPMRKMAAVAEAAGIVCTIGSNLEMGVAGAAMIHVAASTPGIDAESFPCDILSPFYYQGDLLAEPLAIGAGTARAFERPGLGIELDEDKVAYFRTDRTR